MSLRYCYYLVTGIGERKVEDTGQLCGISYRTWAWVGRPAADGNEMINGRLTVGFSNYNYLRGLEAISLTS